jgi:GT2 family glycosyltransferase
MRPSILFVIPTLYTYKSMTINCINALRKNIKQFDIDFKICVVINTPNDDFDRDDFGPGVEKLCSNLNFSISKALNTAIFNNTTFDYFCYVDEGITIDNDYWINYLIDLFTSNNNIGLVGCRPHGTPEKYTQPISNDPLLYQVVWSDGIIFTTMKRIVEIGSFDEAYFADCETQDLGLRLHTAGFTNLFWSNLASHSIISFENKSVTPELLIQHRDNSRKIFHNKWDTFLATSKKYQ